MKLKLLKSTSPGRRHQINIEKNTLSKNSKLLKTSIKSKKQCKGRSNTHGKITAWHRGGGKKLLVRLIDDTDDEKIGLVVATQYDSSKNSFTNLNFDLVSKRFYHELAVENLTSGMISAINTSEPELRLGLRTSLYNIPLGLLVNNISSGKNSKAKYIKAAGTYGQLIKLDLKNAHIKMPSGKTICLKKDSSANLGIISNKNQRKTILGKAGRNRLLGRRSIVRGIAMNPVDHPHGGRTNGGRPSVTPWGLPTKSGFRLKKKNKNA